MGISSMISCLLPIFVGARNLNRDLERASLSIESLYTLNKSNESLSINVLTPQRDLPVVEPRLMRLQRDNLQIDFWADEAFVESSVPSGWVKQQILKLCFCAKAPTQFVLVLDSDIMCCHPYQVSDFFINGKAINNWEGRLLHNWYKNSCELLGISFSSEGYGISVTPEVLCRDICLELIQHLKTMFGEQWQHSIWTKNREGICWSEYSLYTVFAELIGQLKAFHATPAEVFASRLRLTSPLSVWSANGFLDSNLVKIFRSGAPRGIFLVNQSTSNIDPKIAAKLSRQALALQAPVGNDRAT
jgi:hypothetical protein